MNYDFDRTTNRRDTPSVKYDLEQKLSDPQTTLMILCSPHNPIGKIWEKETLGRIGVFLQRSALR